MPHSPSPAASPGPQSPVRDGGESAEIELSVVIPCLNEADTLASCLRKAMAALNRLGVAAEIVVADNDSTDNSPQIAQALGAHVLVAREAGYGSALMAGIAASRGRYVLMADADDSYDFGELGPFLDGLRRGHDLVQGCRLPSGGGQILPGAMPWSHRVVGNPLLSWLARWWFGVRVKDIYCGMRAFTRTLYDRLDLRCTGMEFATEMIIKARLHDARTMEVPITLHPDGRRSHAPHLKTFRDGWRTLRLFLLYCPRWLFLLPGLALLILGALGYGLALPGVALGTARFGAHTLLVASLAMICGYQAILIGVFTKTFAIGEHLLPMGPDMARLFRVFTLERGLFAGLVALLGGLVLVAHAAHGWWRLGFGPLDYGLTMRLVVPGVTLAALGFQTFLSSFFLSLLGLRRR